MKEHEAARGRPAQSQDGLLLPQSHGDPIVLQQPVYDEVRDIALCRVQFTYPLELSAHQQHTGPYTTLGTLLSGDAVEVPLTVIEENLC